MNFNLRTCSRVFPSPPLGGWEGGEFRYLRRRVSQNIPLRVARRRGLAPPERAATYVSALSGFNLLLGAVVKTEVDSYGAYFVTRISPRCPTLRASLLISSLLVRSGFPARERAIAHTVIRATLLRPSV